MLKSLKARIIISIVGIVFMSLIITIFFFGQKAKVELENAYDENAINMLEATTAYLESEYDNMLDYSEMMLKRKEVELKNNTAIAISIVENAYSRYLNGDWSEEEAKSNAINELNKVRYDSGVGYFWIIGTEIPYPTMIMHPFMPELVGESLEAIDILVAEEGNADFFQVVVDKALKFGEGYIDYYWIKPSEDGEIETEDKKSYLKLFEEWEWIIGTGVYVGDIENIIKERITETVIELNTSMDKQKIGESGYLYIFNDDGEVLVHPNLIDGSLETLINPTNGENIISSIISTYDSGEEYYNYVWDKPTDKDSFVYDKKAYISYYKPLGWYIISSYYVDDTKDKIVDIIELMIKFSSLFLIFAILTAVLISRSIVKPLNGLVDAIRITDESGIPKAFDNNINDIELITLSETINKMISSINLSRKDLTEQHEYSQNIIFNSPDIIIGLDSDGYLTFINPKGEQIIGYKGKDIVGKNLWELFFPDELYEQVEILNKTHSDMLVENYELIIKTSHGDLKSIIWNTFVRKDSNGIITEIIGFGADNTDRKLMLEALNESEKRYKTLVEYAPEAILVLNADTGRFIDANENAAMLLGVSQEKLVTLTLDDINPKNQPDGGVSSIDARMHLKSALNGEAPVFEWSHINQETKLEIPCEIRLVQFPSASKNLIRCSILDISKRKKIDLELKRVHKRLSNVFDSATLVSIIATDPEGVINVFSKGAEEMLGYTSDEVVNKMTPGVFHLESEVIERGEVLSKEYKRDINGFDVFISVPNDIGYEEREWTYVKKNGAKLVVNLGVTTMLDDDGNIEGYLGVASDITDRKYVEKELRNSTEELETLNEELRKHEEGLEEIVNNRTRELELSINQLKDTQFKLIESEKMASLGSLVAGVAHEINTPIGIGVTLASHMQEKTNRFKAIYESGKLSKSDLENYVSVAGESSEMLLVNMERAADLIHSFKQIAVDQSSEVLRVFNVKDYINEILNSLHPKFKKTNHTVNVFCSEDIVINSYPGAFSQILTNLLLNSLIHGFENIDNGIIDISINIEGEILKIVYKDSGTGIDEINISKIYEPFFTTKRGQGGSGLGMNIVYNTVTQSLKGTISCESSMESGTKFIIEIPYNV